MADTARNLIQSSLRKMQVYAPGETMTDADAEEGLNVLNAMLDSWSNESLSCFAINEQNATLIVGQYQYTIGVGGTFNMQRPLRILESPGTCYVTDGNGERYPVAVIPQDQWNLIGQIQNVNSNLPNVIFYDPQYPLGIINVFPIPNMSYQLYWDSYLQLSDFSDLDAPVVFPPGYKKAIIDCMAKELWPYFLKGDPTKTIMEQAAISLGNIKRTNIRINIAEYDAEIVAKANGTYNIYRDR